MTAGRSTAAARRKRPGSPARPSAVSAGETQCLSAPGVELLLGEDELLGGVELLLGEDAPLDDEVPPLVPDVPADGAEDEPLLEGELAPGVPAAGGLDEPDVPIVVELFDVLELLPLVDGVFAPFIEDEPEVPVVDGLVADDFAGGVELPLEEPLLPLSPQAARASTPSAALVIKKTFRMYSPPEPKGCTLYRLRKPE